jgi:arylsulfatase A-like enzyme
MAQSPQPNLLVIQTDEHNFRTLGCYRALLTHEEAFIWGDGVAVETPNIDWLAANGAIAERCYATSPVCTPSRASFVSGRYPQNTGAIQNNLPMNDDVITFAEVLRRTGYQTGYAGKWHLDGEGKPQWAPKRKFGFADNRYMFNRGHWKQFELVAGAPRVKARNKQGQPSYDVDGADENSFATDWLTDRAIEFVRANKERPFCYMLSLPDPHGPNSVRSPYDTMFDHLPFKPPGSASAAGQGLPGYASVENGKFNAASMAQYFGMVKCIDDNVGRLLDALRSEGVLKQTVVVFTSDHGDLCGEHGRHNKGVPLDGSARIPFVIHAPGIIEPGTVVRQTLGTVDFKPTVLSLLGVAPGGGDEGRDAAQLFMSGASASEWEDVTFMRIGGPENKGNGWLSAVSQRHKFVVGAKGERALFDLREDPFELTNLSSRASHRTIVADLASALLAYGQNHNEPLFELEGVRSSLSQAVSLAK